MRARGDGGRANAGPAYNTRGFAGPAGTHADNSRPILIQGGLAMKVPRFVTVLLLGFVVLGVGLLVASAFAYRSTRTFLAGGASAEGTIVAYAEARDQEGRLSYHPVVSFRARTANGSSSRRTPGAAAAGRSASGSRSCTTPAIRMRLRSTRSSPSGLPPCCCSRWGWALPGSAPPCSSPSAGRPRAGVVPRQSGCGPRAAG